MPVIKRWGGTYDATGYSYGYGVNAEGGHFPKGSASANQIEMFENVGSAATEGLNAAVELLGRQAQLDGRRCFSAVALWTPKRRQFSPK